MENSENLQTSEGTLKELVSLYKNTITHLKTLSKDKDELRLKIIENMKENKKNEYIAVHEDGKVSITTLQYPKSFDVGQCILENKELSEKYVKVELVEKVTFDKKTFQKEHSDLYEKYLVELSARLSVK